jgi:hypothetical protein
VPLSAAEQERKSPRGRFAGSLALVVGAWLLVCIGAYASFVLYIQSVADRSVLTGIPCEPPCWNGITPGDTMTEGQVEQIVRRTPGIMTIWNPVATSVAWYWMEPPLGWGGGRCGVYLTDNVVTSISLSFVPVVTVADIVAKYGLPNLVTHSADGGLPERPYYWIGLFYPLKGYHFYAAVETYSEPVLLPSSRVISASYFKPYTSVEEWEPSPRPGVRVPWPGYGPLPRNPR